MSESCLISTGQVLMCLPLFLLDIFAFFKRKNSSFNVLPIFTTLCLLAYLIHCIYINTSAENDKYQCPICKRELQKNHNLMNLCIDLANVNHNLLKCKWNEAHTVCLNSRLCLIYLHFAYNAKSYGSLTDVEEHVNPKEKHSVASNTLQYTKQTNRLQYYKLRQPVHIDAKSYVPSAAVLQAITKQLMFF